MINEVYNSMDTVSEIRENDNSIQLLIQALIYSLLATFGCFWLDCCISYKNYQRQFLGSLYITSVFGDAVREG